MVETWAAIDFSASNIVFSTTADEESVLPVEEDYNLHWAALIECALDKID